MYKRLKFDYARNALKYLILELNIKEIHLPYYLCDVVRHSVVKADCRPIFYHIDNNFMPAVDFSKSDYILYPNYFGVCNKNAEVLSIIYPNLIVDNAHSFYSKPLGLASIYSEHKFLPVESGAYLYSKDDMSNDEIDFPIDTHKELRVKSFFDLHKKYSDKNCLEIIPKSITSPFCYPYLAPNEESADKLAEKLMREGNIIYRYWNPLPKMYNEYKFYRNLVPIPFDF